MSPEPIGIVLTVVRGGCEVVAGDLRVALRLTGRQAHSDVELAVGDEVRFDPVRGVVLELLPRRSWLERRRPRDDPRRRHVIAANIDRLAIITAIRRPAFRAGLVDRMQLAALAGGLDAILVVNKMDLWKGELPDEIRSFEAALPVVPVSAEAGSGLEALSEALAGRRSVFAGHSGVGKSSLLNALQPELRLATGALGHRRERGRHTTRSSTWLRLRGGAIVIDTPGIRELASGVVDPALLAELYPEVAKLAPECRFRDCSHVSEPGCAVRSAIEAGELSEQRYAQYLRVRTDLVREEA